MFNAPEPVTNRRDEMELNDKECFVDICKAIGVTIPGQEIKGAVRLGKKREDGGARPLLIKLATPNKKATIFKNYNKLANTQCKDISISNDLTKLQREQNKRLRDQAKRMEEEDKSGKHYYRVVGPPWDRRIIKTEKVEEQKDQGAGGIKTAEGEKKGD